MSKITYDEYVRKYSNFFLKIILDNDEIIKIKDFTTNLIEVKKKESHHIKDSGSEKKRWLTGLLGERAVEKYLGLKFMDFTIGNSRKYHVSDMKIAGYNCGVKTVEKGKFPIIFKLSYKPEIIVIREDKVENLLWICGLATTDVLNNHQSDSLILSPSLKSRGTKTGFYGFDRLIHPDKILDYLDNHCS